MKKRMRISNQQMIPLLVVTVALCLIIIGLRSLLSCRLIVQNNLNQPIRKLTATFGCSRVGVNLKFKDIGAGSVQWEEYDENLSNDDSYRCLHIEGISITGKKIGPFTKVLMASMGDLGERMTVVIQPDGSVTLAPTKSLSTFLFRSSY